LLSQHSHTGYGLEGREIEVRIPKGRTGFLSSAASRLGLGPIQPPIKWVPGALSAEVMRPRREAVNSFIKVSVTETFRMTVNGRK
jgi:hypothetical protein